MATVFVTSNLYPENPHIFVVDMQKIVTIGGEANTSFHRNRRGERYWKANIHTSGLDYSGDSLGPYWVGTYTTEQTLNELINDKIEEICQLIDWSKSSLFEDDFQQTADKYPPVIYWQYPSAGQINVPIDSIISIRLRDLPPAKGIDVSTLVFKVDGFTVIPEVSGNKYDTVLVYKPRFNK